MDTPSEMDQERYRVDRVDSVATYQHVVNLLNLAKERLADAPYSPALNNGFFAIDNAHEIMAQLLASKQKELKDYDEHMEKLYLDSEISAHALAHERA